MRAPYTFPLMSYSVSSSLYTYLLRQLEKDKNKSNVRIRANVANMSIKTYIIILKGNLYLIDGKADGLHVLTHFPHTAPVLLHQAHNEGAALLTIIRVIIHLMQLYDKLRIHPKGI